MFFVVISIFSEVIKHHFYLFLYFELIFLFYLIFHKLKSILP